MSARATSVLGASLIASVLASLLIGLPALAQPSPDAATQASVVARVAALPATVTVNLCAKAGSLALPGAADPVPIWGFALDPGTGCGDAQLPGPTIDVTVGDTLIVNLTNQLDEPVSIVFPGQSEPPDMVGAAPAGGTTTYTLTPASPGTYLYESGTNVSRQVPMGLHGTLVVRADLPGTAYGGADSAYERDAVLVLSEIDPRLNADPNGFDLLEWHPTYWLINGKAYPETVALPVEAGDRVLLRYANAGIDHHTMALLGLHQRVFARDAAPLNFPFDAISETIPAGQTADMIATVPAGAAAATRFPVYSRNLHVTNVNAFPGGMLTFFDVQASAALPVVGIVPELLSIKTVTPRAHRVRIAARVAECKPCKATARLRVRGVWRSLSMTRRGDTMIALFRKVPSGRGTYVVTIRDIDSGVRVTSPRRSVRVR